MKAIIIVGNPVDGLEFYGPFNSREEAIAHANGDPHIDNNEWWVADVHPVESNANVVKDDGSQEQ